MTSRAGIWIATLVLLGSAGPAHADAVRGERGTWSVGGGWAWGRGTFQNPQGAESGYDDGSSAQMRTARRIGRFLQVGADYRGWAIEFGRETDSTGVFIKARRSVQSLSASVTVFPGKPNTVLGSFFVRGGVGLGWAGTTLRKLELGIEQGHGERIDEFGVGYMAELGFEFWVADRFTVAVGSNWNYFDIGGDSFVDKAWYGSGIVIFNVYFGGP